MYFKNAKQITIFEYLEENMKKDKEITAIIMGSRYNQRFTTGLNLIFDTFKRKLDEIDLSIDLARDEIQKLYDSFASTDDDQ